MHCKLTVKRAIPIGWLLAHTAVIICKTNFHRFFDEKKKGIKRKENSKMARGAHKLLLKEKIHCFFCYFLKLVYRFY